LTSRTLSTARIARARIPVVSPRVLRCVLHPGNGDLAKLFHLAEAARTDFRDVVYQVEYYEPESPDIGSTGPFCSGGLAVASGARPGWEPTLRKQRGPGDCEAYTRFAANRDLVLPRRFNLRRLATDAIRRSHTVQPGRCLWRPCVPPPPLSPRQPGNEDSIAFQLWVMRRSARAAPRR
jgi:hypothetical protein